MRPDRLAPAVQRQLERLPAPYDAHYGVVPLAPPQGGIDLTSIIKRHEAAIAAMAHVDTLAASMVNPFLVSRLLLRQEAVNSSSIEGTQSTLDELLSIEETGDADATKDAKQVRDYAQILGLFIKRAQLEGPAIFTLDLIQDLHRQIMKADISYRDKPGHLRETVVWIGSGPIAQSSWNAPPPAKVETCLEQSLAYMRNEGTQRMMQSFITRMAVAHAHFEAVHPFRDGNGRVGRMLLPLAMVAEGHVPLYLSPFIEARRGGYYGALKTSQQQLDWTAIVGFLCDAIVGTVAHLDDTIVMLGRLQEAWSQRRKFRKGSGPLRALDVLVDYPVVTAKRLAGELDIGFGNALDALAQLTAIGIVKERTGYKRNRVFVADEVLAIVNRPYDD